MLRSDRIMVVAFSIALAGLTAAVGAAAAYRPHTEQIRTTASLAVPPVPPAPPARAAALPAPARPAVKTVDDLIADKLLAEHRCLSEVLYYEARGEGVQGEKAVAEVVFHRMRTGNYGHSICAVVYEGADRPGCQFSFTCNGDLRGRKAPQAWLRAQILAARILTGEESLGDVTEGATSFHAASVLPDWANDLQRTVQIGNHIFYRNGSRSRTM
jgi:spore germination cell wall hydrolase CwlJ-like protein